MTSIIIFWLLHIYLRYLFSDYDTIIIIYDSDEYGKSEIEFLANLANLACKFSTQISIH